MPKDCQIWVSVKRIGTDVEDFLSTVGVKFSYNLNAETSYSNSPIAFGYDSRTGQKYLINYYQRVGAIANNLQYEGFLPVRYEEPTSTNQGMVNVINIAFDPFNDENKVALVSQSRELVRVYDTRGEAAPILEIGSYNQVGNAVDNRLSEAKDALFLADGSILVANGRGNGAQSTVNRGHVSRYDGTTGQFMETWLEPVGDNIPKLGNSVAQYPRRLRYDPSDSNAIWIACSTDVLKFDLTEKKIIDMVMRPTGLNGSAIQSIAFLSDGNLAVLSQEAAGFYVVNLETKELVNHVDVRLYGGTEQVRDLIELQPGYVAVVCWAATTKNRVVVVVPTFKTLEVTYTEPKIESGYEIAVEVVPSWYDVDSFRLNVPVADACSIKKSDRLAIPLRKIC